MTNLVRVIEAEVRLGSTIACEKCGQSYTPIVSTIAAVQWDSKPCVPSPDADATVSSAKRVAQLYNND
jgi:hypothetical protein